MEILKTLGFIILIPFILLYLFAYRKELNRKINQSNMKEAKVEVIMLACMECGQMLPIKANGVEMRNGLNIFCHDKDCEDKYAFKQ
jgi:hypothetical protein